MRHFITSALLSFLAMAVANTTAQACINDREVERIEREFKSQYQVEPQPKDVSPEPANQGVPLALSGTGVVLLLGSVVVCLKPAKQS